MTQESIVKVKNVNIPRAAEILERMAFGDERYLIGVFARGVTVYKQQVRALNLVWALQKEGKIEEGNGNDLIAVVGGGIAGLTAAAALVKRGIRNVYLFEQRPALCPLQEGCNTRWIHPHVYDWPRVGSERVQAGLPIMNWREGRASDVVYNLLKEWDQDYRAKVKEVKSATYLKINGKRIEWRGVCDGEKNVEGKEFKIIILAVGFGVERRFNKRATASYWRDETYGQPLLDVPFRNFLVSGGGDSGFIDLLRIRLQQFRQDRIVDELFGSHPKIVRKLIKIAEDASLQSSSSLYNALESLRMGKIVNNVRRRLRTDTSATLQLKDARSVSSLLSPDASFMNRILVYLLWKAGGFTPRYGELKEENITEFEGENVVIRHGVDREAHVKALFGEEDVVYLINYAKARPDCQDIERPCWPGGHWKSQSVKKEFVAPAVVALASAFMSTVDGVLAHSAAGVRYRATLHRLVEFGGEHIVQQVSQYVGSRATEGEKTEIGRVFDIDFGVTGLAVRTGRTIVLSSRPDTPEAVETLHKELKGLKVKLESNSAVKVRSIYASPFLSGKNVMLVLFVDAETSNFFSKPTRDALLEACKGFARYLDRIEKGAPEVRAIRSEYRGYSTDGKADLLKNLSTLVKDEEEKVEEVPRTKLIAFDVEWQS